MCCRCPGAITAPRVHQEKSYATENNSVWQGILLDNPSISRDLIFEQPRNRSPPATTAPWPFDVSPRTLGTGRSSRRCDSNGPRVVGV